MKASELTTVLKGCTARVPQGELTIEQLLTDSRHAGQVSRALFFSIPTKRNTGCRYVADLYQRGVRNFVVPQELPEPFRTQFDRLRDANFWEVKDVVSALQQVAGWHRKQYD
ncbi:MAG: bifunctional UDP-N-acetylmuramoyl-tripeptide:D-alanyl-D-alanine ligase/alanine racemase, partial [Bacteroidales bacterium]|nr:bifunctional UDP-N-acetylmuramoyl-tripeptide:D-alanyl-D-alanine ligase/alanine racemase [Bacteroidales bacterium]